MRRMLAHQIGIGFVVLAGLFIAWPFISSFLNVPEIFGSRKIGQAVRYTGALLLIFPAVILLRGHSSRK